MNDGPGTLLLGRWLLTGWLERRPGDDRRPRARDELRRQREKQLVDESLPEERRVELFIGLNLVAAPKILNEAGELFVRDGVLGRAPNE